MSFPLPPFLFVICQAGATSALRREVLRLPDLRLAFSQPGFATFKLAEEVTWPEAFPFPVTLARTYGWCLGKIAGTNADELVEQVLATTPCLDSDAIHVYERDTRDPGMKGFEPGITPLATEIAARIDSAVNRRELGRRLPVNQVALPDQLVFDVILSSPSEWWLGCHRASRRHLRWVGGVPQFDREREVISRAWFKLAEAVEWSGFRFSPGETVAEIGSAPGGSCEWLLERGMNVIAIDPADLDPAIADHPRLKHLKMRGQAVRKRDLKDARWLVADLNVAPTYTLDTVAEIVASQHTNIRGMLLTLKLSDWKLVDEIPKYLARVREMGFQFVQSRQLAFNRREFCIAAATDRFEVRKRKLQPRPKVVDSDGAEEG